MLDFTGEDEQVKLIALHYAKELSDEFIINLISNNDDVKNSAEAISLAEFFWKSLDLSAKDAEENRIVLGEPASQYWMERLMNIVSGYLCNNGYESEWQKVCDAA